MPDVFRVCVLLNVGVPAMVPENVPPLHVYPESVPALANVARGPNRVPFVLVQVAAFDPLVVQSPESSDAVKGAPPLTSPARLLSFNDVNVPAVKVPAAAAVPPMAGGEAKYVLNPVPDTVELAERVVNAPLFGVPLPMVPGTVHVEPRSCEELITPLPDVFSVDPVPTLNVPVVIVPVPGTSEDQLLEAVPEHDPQT